MGHLQRNGEEAAAIAEELFSKLRSCERSLGQISDLTLEGNNGRNPGTILRAVHQIARQALSRAPLADLECQSNCQRYHTRSEVAQILGVHSKSVYQLEGKGLRVSRRTGNPRYLHAWIDEFMAR